ncbi:MAG: ATP-dependent metallopeptidase FtsH/Yme1/Tma family protein, partial [Alphaproteobacteria bacterium]
MNQNFRNFALWIVILLLLVALFNLFQNPSGKTSARDIAYSEFRGAIDEGKVTSVTIAGQEITGTFDNNDQFRTYAPIESDYVTALEDNGVSIRARPENGEMTFVSVLISWFPMLLLIAVWIFFMRQMQGAGGKAMGFGKSKAKLLTEAHGKVTFDDVAGVDEAKEDLEEIVEFLRDPQKF